MNTRLKQVRVALFKSQMRFANFLNVTIQAVSSYETGKSTIPTEKIIKLMNEYNISANWLLKGLGEMVIQENENTNNVENEIEEIEEIKKENEKLKYQIDILKEVVKRN